MKSLEKGEDKIQKICEALRKETIEPAKKDALKIIEEAKRQAEAIVAEAEGQAKEIMDRTKIEIEQGRNVFQSSLQQAAKQSVEALRQEIEKHLFNTQLDQILEKQMQDPKIIASLINAIIKAIEKKGIDTSIEALIPQEVSPREINELLLAETVKQLKNHSVTVGSFKGGAQVRLVNKKITVDMTEDALKELMASFVRKDFRKLIFNA